MKSAVLLLLPAAILSAALSAQITVTPEAYARSEKVQAANQKVYEDAVTPQWLLDGKALWWETRTRAGTRFRLIRANDGRRWEAETRQALAEALQADAPVLAQALTEAPKSAGESPKPDSAVSPDGATRAFLRDHNLWIRPAKGDGPAMPLTFDGCAEEPYELSSLRWSPDNARIALFRVRPVELPRLPLRRSAPEDSVYATARDVFYPRPGDHLASRTPVLVDVAARRAVPVSGLETLGPQYSLEALRWRPDAKAFTFEFIPRGFGGFVIGEVFADGAFRRRVDERTDTFFPHTLRVRRDLADGLSTLWVSERDGWRHLWQFFADGRAPVRITKGEWVVRDILRVDESAGQLLFTASGLVSGEDPYNVHLCSVRLDGADFRDLTPENATHAINLSPDGTVFVDNVSRPDLPCVSRIRRTADGALVAELQRQDIADLLASGWMLPQVFHAKGRDGKTDIWGTLRLPPDFDPAKRHPVLECIYAGPHDAHVPKAFLPCDYFADILTALGFVVVRIDGMGTAWRSKAFHDVCWKNLRDAGFPDRIAWLQAAAQDRPWLDLSRVGIYGWSAGGQNALAALLWHGDFYKAAIALCGCHDNRIDKLWWNEQWMGWPVGPWYAENSNVVNAYRLNGRLFLINGENDDNVDPASSLMVAHALIRAGKDFEQLYLPNAGHALSGPFIEHRMKDFFVRALSGQTPPPWNTPARAP